MKTLFVFLVGIVVGAAALYYYQQKPGAPREVASSTADRARSATHDAAANASASAQRASDTLGEKMREWHLTPADIHADLARGGEIARANADRVRAQVSDARVVATIKAKLVLDRDLSARDINVDSTAGDVTLTGSVESEALVGRAVALALDTDGVQHVTSKLSVAAEGK